MPDYLKSDEEAVTNYMDWGVQLGRRFRALKLWMVIRHFGAEGLEARIKEHIRLGQLMAGWIDDHLDFERLAPTPFSTICFRANPSDIQQILQTSKSEEELEKVETYLEDLNRAIIRSVNASGEVYCTATTLKGKYSLRMAIGNIRSDESWVTLAWEKFKDGAKTLDAIMRPESLQR